MLGNELNVGSGWIHTVDVKNEFYIKKIYELFLRPNFACYADFSAFFIRFVVSSYPLSTEVIEFAWNFGFYLKTLSSLSMSLNAD